jgi:hypothetical protein
MDATTTTTQSAPAAPLASGSLMPGNNANPEAEDLLKQTDLLKGKLSETERSRAQEQAEMQKKLARLDYLEQQASQQADKYRKEQEPKYTSFVTGLEQTLGRPLDEEKKKQYYNAFTKPQYADDAEILMKQHEERVSLAASKKSQEDRLRELELKNKELTEAVAAAAKSVGGMRSSYAQALSEDVTASSRGADDAQRRTHPSATSQLRANEILCATPSAAELPFLTEYGYASQVSVNASGFGGGSNDTRLFRTSVTAAREHGLLKDENRDLQFGAGARYHNPAVFAWMVNDSGLADADLSNYVSINASRTFTERQGVEDK